MFVPAFAARGAAPAAAPEAAVPQVVPCPATCLRCSYGAAPATPAISRAVGVLLTLHLRPLALPASTAPRADAVPLLVRTRTDIVRCDACCAFLSPHAAVSPDGRSWTCALCGATQPFPHSSRNSNGSGDKTSTSTATPASDPTSPERTHCCVEYVLPSAPDARSPMAPCFVCVLDVSRAAVRSGLLGAAAGALRRWAAHYADNRAARVAFVLAGRAPALVPLVPRAALLVVPDPADATAASLRAPLPVRPETLLVPLATHRAAILDFLRKLEAFASGGGADSSNFDVPDGTCALPAALYTALRFARFWGGRVLVFSSATVDISDEDEDEDNKSSNKDENDEEESNEETYRSIALECCQRQLSVDVVLVDSACRSARAGTRVAALDELAHHTGGSLVSVPPCSGTSSDDLSAATAMRTVLALLCRTTGWESTAYLYAGAGASFTRVAGNCFVRGRETVATLCAGAANTLSIDLALEAPKTSSSPVCVQCAFVHTTAGASRRVRVLTVALPYATSVHGVFATLDASAIAAASASAAAARLAAGARIRDVRELVVARLVAAMRAYAAAYDAGAAPANSAGVRLPESLAPLPLCVLALLKSPLLTEDPVPPASRALWAASLRALAPEALLQRILPRLFDLSAILSQSTPEEDGGQEQEEEQDNSGKRLAERLVPLTLSETVLEAGHVYLLDSGLALGLYAHGESAPELVRALFGADTLAEAPLAAVVARTAPPETLAPACRVLAHLIDAAERDALPTPRVRVLPALADLRPFLVVDHTHGYYSYHEFVTMLAH